MSIPTILVENEPMETERGPDIRSKGTKAHQEEGRVLQGEMGPGTPDKGKAPITSVGNVKRVLH